MPQPKKKPSSKKSPSDPLKKFREFREKERQNYRNKYPSKSEYEIQSMINENKRKEFGKVLEKSKKPPKTAMDSVRTMPNDGMRKNTITEMRKKDMMYGGKKPTNAHSRISNIDKMMTTASSDSKKRLKKRKASIQKQMASKKKPMGYGGKKMENGGSKRKPAMRTGSFVSPDNIVPNIKKDIKRVKKVLKKAPKPVKEVVAYAVNPVGYIANKAMKGKKFGKKTKVAPPKMKKTVTSMKMKKKVTPRMAMKKTIKKKTR